MIKILALDLDDTLLRSDKSLAPTTRELLSEWTARGNRVVIATGRPPRSAGESLPEELWEAPWICYNGADIQLRNTSVYTDLLPVDAAKRTVRALLTALPEAAIGLEVDDVLYLNRRWERPYPYEVADLMELEHGPVAKILFFHDAIDGLDGLFTEIETSAQIMVSTKYRLVQIMSPTADKVTALRHLVKTWDMDLTNVMAFGDDINDVKMVRECGIGVAVENAVDEVKAVADRITLSNDEGGVDIVLRELLEQ